MIETKKLKRGNLVYDHRNNICEVDEVHEKSVTLMTPNYGRMTYEDGAVYPIPLQEKVGDASSSTILEHIIDGLKVIRYDDFSYYLKDNVIIDIRGDVFAVFKMEDDLDKFAPITHCYYVHELQNLLDSIGVVYGELVGYIKD